MHDDIGDLYHAGYRRLVAQVYAFTTDLTEAQDAVQEAFARALARRNGLSDIDSPEAWLRTVAVNIVRRRWRRRQLLNTILLRERPLTKALQEAPEPDRADLRGALATLPRTYREVIVLHYLADLPVGEVAAILEVPVGTVKSRLSRGREALKGLLDDLDAPPLTQVKARAGQIRTRRRVAQTSVALAVVCMSAVGFFTLRPGPGLPPATPPTIAAVPSYTASGITVYSLNDLNVTDLPGTIESVAVEGSRIIVDTGSERSYSVDGGQTWGADPFAPVAMPQPAPFTQWASYQGVYAGYEDGKLTVGFSDDLQKISLEVSGAAVTGTVRNGMTTLMAIDEDRKIIAVYRGNARGFQQVSDGGGMSVSGEPVSLADGRLLVADAQSRWQLSDDGGSHWYAAGNALPNVGSLHSTYAGYVALDLFRTGWVAVSTDGLTWHKLPVR